MDLEDRMKDLMPGGKRDLLRRLKELEHKIELSDKISADLLSELESLKEEHPKQLSLTLDSTLVSLDPDIPSYNTLMGAFENSFMKTGVVKNPGSFSSYFSCELLDETAIYCLMEPTNSNIDNLRSMNYNSNPLNDVGNLLRSLVLIKNNFQLTISLEKDVINKYKRSIVDIIKGFCYLAQQDIPKARAMAAKIKTKYMKDGLIKNNSKWIISSPCTKSTLYYSLLMIGLGEDKEAKNLIDNLKSSNHITPEKITNNFDNCPPILSSNYGLYSLVLQALGDPKANEPLNLLYKMGTVKDLVHGLYYRKNKPNAEATLLFAAALKPDGYKMFI